MVFLSVLVSLCKQAQLSLRKKVRLNAAALFGDFSVLSGDTPLLGCFSDTPLLGCFSDFDLLCTVQTVVLEIKVFYGR